MMGSALQTADDLTDDLGLDTGWYLDVYSTPINELDYAVDATNIGIQQDFCGPDEKANSTNAAFIFTRLQPLAPEHDSRVDTMDPSTLWPASMDNSSMSSQLTPTQALSQTYGGWPTQQSPLSSSLPRFSSRSSPVEQTLLASATANTLITRRSKSLQTSIPASITSESTPAISPSESETTRRARYAANQRHNKAQKARKESHNAGTISGAGTLDQERRKRHREKNKVAAAKCRSRQRKQAQTIQEKGSRLGEKNAELKVMIQELRGELNGLRSMALDHQQCSCYVARYNLTQADRVVAEYRLSCFGQQFGGFEQLSQQQQQQRYQQQEHFQGQ